MTETTRASLKSTFSTGATADATDFEDLIDSSPNYSDDVGVFFRAFVSAATTADARSLLNITAGGTVAAALNDLVDVSVASPNNNAILQYVSNKWIPYDTGTAGREILAAAATASVHDHLGFGTVGIQVFGSETTASINNIIGISPTTFGESVIEASTMASGRKSLGFETSPAVQLVLTTVAGETETTSMGFSDPSLVFINLECISSIQGFASGQTVGKYDEFGFSVYTSGSTIGIVMGNNSFSVMNPAGSVKSVTAQAFSSFRVVAQAIKFS